MNTQHYSYVMDHATLLSKRTFAYNKNLDLKDFRVFCPIIEKHLAGSSRI